MATRGVSIRPRPEGQFEDTAAVIKKPDLVITLDPTVANLAGAIGAPAWIALPSAPEWRQLRDRDGIPWYPTDRLFRQARPGDRGDISRRIAKAARSGLADRTSVQVASAGTP